MAIIPEKPTPHPFLAFLFVGLENQGKEALKNVRLVLEYKKQYLADNQLLQSVSQFEPTVIQSRYEPNTAFLLKPQRKVRDLRKTLERREVVKYGEMAQISCEIPIIRPGEGVMFSDLLLLRGQGPDDFKGLEFVDEGFQNILTSLREIKSLKDYFVVSILAFAENHEKAHSRLSVLRFSNGTDPEEAFDRFMKALWFGEKPLSGYYFSNRIALWIRRKRNTVGRLSQKIIKDEIGIITFPEVALVRTKMGQAFAMEVPDISQGRCFKITSPNCDYYALPRHVNNFKTLWAWMGIPDKPFKLFRRKKEEKPRI